MNGLAPFLPYLILSGAALVFLFVALNPSWERKTPFLSVVTFLTGLAALASLIQLPSGVVAPGGVLVHDPLGKQFAVLFLGLLVFTVPILRPRSDALRSGAVATFTLLLLCATGGLLMIFANHLLLFFVGLELLSLPLYVLTSMGADQNKGSEAGFKYFLTGAVASSLLVYGIAILWAALGTLQISELATAFSNRTPSMGLLALGSGLFLAGVAFKLGLVPFQMWLPDVYEGAPSSLVAFMSGGVKAAVLPMFLRIVQSLFPHTTTDWSLILTIVAMASMCWGSFGALFQKNIKRMLAYSSIAHAGYLTIGLICATKTHFGDASAGILFYVVSYSLGTLGSFIVLSLEEAEGRVTIQDMAGLAKRRPGLGFIMAISMFTLAGIPPLAGFVAKFTLFQLAASQDRYFLVLVAVLTSLISLGYYLRVLVAVYMEESNTSVTPKLRLHAGTVLGVITAASLILGLFPARLLELLLKTGFSAVP